MSSRKKRSRCPACGHRHKRGIKRTTYYSKGSKVYAKDYRGGEKIKRFVKKCSSERTAKKSVMRLNA